MLYAFARDAEFRQLTQFVSHAEQLGVAVDVEAAFHRTVLGTVPLRTQHA